MSKTADDLYERDALAWSEQQADLLRRVARGESPNDVDWPHIIEEIEDVGLSELHACQSLLMQAMAHLLKARGWPAGPVSHWRSEAAGFLAQARRRYAASMRRKLDLAGLYRDALNQVLALTVNGDPPGLLPVECPLRLDDLIADEPDLDRLLDKLASATPTGPARSNRRRAGR